MRTMGYVSMRKSVTPGSGNTKDVKNIYSSLFPYLCDNHDEYCHTEIIF
jgi:hypothetical protein